MIAAGGSYSDTVTIDAGSKDGIQANETVLNGNGLVGTVTSVGPTTSTVLLASDASATVGVRLAGTNTIGAITGAGTTMAGSDMLRLRLFSASATLQPGDALVTFGSVGGRPYVRRGPRRHGHLRHQPAGGAHADRAGYPVRGLLRPRRGRRGHRAAARRPARLGARRALTMRILRRALVPLAFLVLAVLAQVTMVNRLPLPGGASPDLVLLVVTALAVTGGPVPGMLAGFAGGLALDLAPPVSDLAGEYGLRLLRRRIRLRRAGHAAIAQGADSRSATDAWTRASGARDPGLPVLASLPVMVVGVGIAEALRAALA